MNNFFKIILILVGGFIYLLVFYFGIFSVENTEITKSDAEVEKERWDAIKIGDSIYFDHSTYLNRKLNIYSLFRVKLDYSEQKKIKFSAVDTTSMGVVRTLHEKYFYLRKTGLVGKVIEKCETPYFNKSTGIPYSVTFYGNQYNYWLKIKLVQELANLKVDYSNHELFNDDLLGKYWVAESNILDTKEEDMSFYVKLNDVNVVDSIFPNFIK